jgi:hypothetical protein
MTDARDASTEAVFNAMNWALPRRADVNSMVLGINFPRVVEQFVEVAYLRSSEGQATTRVHLTSKTQKSCGDA